MSRRRWWWGLGWVWVGVVLYLTLTPAPPPDPWAIPYLDKWAHGAAFAWLAWWFAQVVARRGRLAAALVALGVGIELLQLWGGVRRFEWADMLADGFGVAVGLLLARGPLGGMVARSESIGSDVSDKERR